jgi:anti-anti-sigma regulatory factor
MKLSSKLHISGAEKLANELLSMVEQAQAIELDISDVESVDTASFQVLCATQKSLSAVDSEIVWSGSSDVFIQSAKQLGVAEFLGFAS